MTNQRAQTLTRPANQLAPGDVDDWRDLAACAPGSGVPPELFYGPDELTWGHKETPATRRRRVESAKAVCATCPLIAKQACLAEAISERDSWGIRAGLTPDQIRALIPKRVVTSLEPTPLTPDERPFPPDCPDPVPGGRSRHRRRGERTCRACLGLKRAYERARYNERRDAEGDAS